MTTAIMAITIDRKEMLMAKCADKLGYRTHLKSVDLKQHLQFIVTYNLALVVGVSKLLVVDIILNFSDNLRMWQLSEVSKRNANYLGEVFYKRLFGYIS
jgi:hypothetical protein